MIFNNHKEPWTEAVKLRSNEVPKQGSTEVRKQPVPAIVGGDEFERHRGAHPGWPGTAGGQHTQDEATPRREARPRVARSRLGPAIYSIQDMQVSCRTIISAGSAWRRRLCSMMHCRGLTSHAVARADARADGQVGALC
jgi:hypothetical protein